MMNKFSYGLVIFMLIVTITGVMSYNSTNPINNNAPFQGSSHNSIANSNFAVNTVSNNIMVSNNTLTLKNSKKVLRSHEILKNNELAQEIADLK